jgi:hypothetical protein
VVAQWGFQQVNVKAWLMRRIQIELIVGFSTPAAVQKFPIPLRLSREEISEPKPHEQRFDF